MIAKQVKGRGFRGTLNYLLQKPEAELIGGNMLGETPRELAAEFAESRKLRPNLTKAVYHASLSLAPGEKFSDEKWREVAGRYTKEMGFDGSQYAIIRHKDTEHDHVHIVASRIRMDGSTVSDSQDYKRSEKVVRGLEIENNLTRVPNSHEVLRRAPTGDELRKTLRTNTPSARMQLQGLVDRAMKGSPDVAEFFTRLESLGVQPVPNVAKTGHVSGISYVLGGEMMKGSDLGRGYTWQGIQKRGVSYGREGNVDRESKAISRAVERAKVGPSRAVERGKTVQSRERDPKIRRESPEINPSSVGDRQSGAESNLSKREEPSGAGRETGAIGRGNDKTLFPHKRGSHGHERVRQGVDGQVEGGVGFGKIGRIVDRITGKETEREDLGHSLNRRDVKRPSDRHRIFTLAEAVDGGKTTGAAMEKLREELRKAHELSKKHVSKNVRLDSREIDGPEGPDRGGRGM